MKKLNNMKPRKLEIKSKIRAYENSIGALQTMKNVYDKAVNASGALASDMYKSIDEHLEYFYEAISILKTK